MSNEKRWLVAIYQEYSVIRGDTKHAGSALHSQISVLANTAQDAVSLGEVYIKAFKIPDAYVNEVVSEHRIGTVYFEEPLLPKEEEQE